MALTGLSSECIPKCEITDICRAAAITLSGESMAQPKAFVGVMSMSKINLEAVISDSMISLVTK